MGDIAAPSGFKRGERPFARGRVNDAVENYGGRNGTEVRIVLRILPVPAPQLLAGRWIVAGDAIASENDNLSLVAILQELRSGIGIGRLADCGRGTLDAPEC